MAAAQDQQDSQQIDPILTPEFVERRAHPRHAVDCPVRISLLNGGGEILGRISDLSLGGCLIAPETRQLIGVQVRLELSFRLRGIAFRMAGVTVSMRNATAFAIRFLHVPAQRQQELAAVLEEEAASNATLQPAEASKPPAFKVSPSGAALSAPGASSGLNLVAETPSPKPKEQRVESGAAMLPSAPVPPAAKDRRSSSRHAVDTRANLLLVKTGIIMPGRILNLSLGGCQIRMEERFNVGIYVRVEAEFFLHGLPFRVGGVSQAIVDKFTIGIRFLDMSDRRRHQLAELIEEIAEAKAEGFDPTASAPLPAPEPQ